ncbi:hypothetical protein OpiT1DRAFT_04860 [Opitutaceae bacterium TAV1]|nr:hypothetical protein OpiT1DRAFT_04860 [Opitutaceae bacterium TAV1]
MISRPLSTTSSTPERIGALPAQTRTAATGAAPRAAADEWLSAIHAANLQAALAALPEIRPEAVARARDLAADPAWPDAGVIDAVARLVSAAADLSAIED